MRELPHFRLRWLADRDPGRAAWLDDDEWVPRGERRLYARAKQGLADAFETLPAGETVLLPAYVPGGVAWAAVVADLEVAYYPVNDDLSLPADAVGSRVREIDPAAVVFVHFLGFVDPVFRSLAATVREHDALVVEDCARGLFGCDADGRPLGETGDVALFCPHKTLPAPNGGLVVSSSVDLPDPGPATSEGREVCKNLGRSAVNQRHNPPPPIRRPIDRRPADVAPAERRASPGWVSRRALAHVRPSIVRSARQGAYGALRELLVDAPGLTVLTPATAEGASPYGVAVRAPSARDREAVFRAVNGRGLPCEVLTWPPVVEHDALAAFEGAETLRDRLLIFPTHQDLTGRQIGHTGAVAVEAAAEAADAFETE